MQKIEKERLTSKISLPKWIIMEHQERYKFAAKYVKNKTVIDCACGSGMGTFIFSQESPSTIRAFDISEDALKEARHKCKDKNISFEISDAINLPLANNCIDVYISLETIEHLKNDTLFLKESSRVLKNDGTFICSTPNRIVTNPGKTLLDKPANKFHMREYSIEEFESLLKKYFSIVNLYGQSPNKKSKAKILNLIGKILPFHLATRIHQGMKLILFFVFPKNIHNYSVQEIKKDFEYEYITAVCQK